MQNSNPKYSTDLETLKKETDEEFFGSSGHGGQNVNKRATAVRLRHRPSGFVVKEQRQRTQGQNRRIAFKRLQKKLEDKNNPPLPRTDTRVPPREKIKRRSQKRLRKETLSRRKTKPED